MQTIVDAVLRRRSRAHPRDHPLRHGRPALASSRPSTARSRSCERHPCPRRWPGPLRVVLGPSRRAAGRRSPERPRGRVRSTGCGARPSRPCIRAETNGARRPSHPVGAPSRGRRRSRVATSPRAQRARRHDHVRYKATSRTIRAPPRLVASRSTTMTSAQAARLFATIRTVPPVEDLSADDRHHRSGGEHVGAQRRDRAADAAPPSPKKRRRATDEQQVEHDVDARAAIEISVSVHARSSMMSVIA